MALLVQKFGGTSVGSLERIQAVADKVVATRNAGHDVVVAVSAMGGETDRLIDMARQLNKAPEPREMDMLLSTGEQVTVALLSQSLLAAGCPTRSMTGGQAGIITNNSYSRARIESINAEAIRANLSQGTVSVVAGFQGIDSEGNITTLGRGGSDTTAVALACALQADECQIYTDVDGVYTTDPRIVPSARRLDRITFEEMLEMSSLGAKVLQLRAVEFAGKYQMPLRVLSSFEEGPGTLITYEEQTMEDPIVSGIAFNRSEAKLTMLGVPDMPGVASEILGAVRDEMIDVDMIIQNMAADGKTDFTFTVHRDDFERTMKIMEATAERLGAAEVSGDVHIAKISLVGVGMRSHAGVAGQMFEVLAEEGINIQMISTSEIKVSVIVDEKYLELGVRALHSAFGLDAAEPKEEFDPKH